MIYFRESHFINLYIVSVEHQLCAGTVVVIADGWDTKRASMVPTGMFIRSVLSDGKNYNLIGAITVAWIKVLRVYKGLTKCSGGMCLGKLGFKM